MARARSRPFGLPLCCRRATGPPLGFLPLVLFHPHSSSRLLVFAFIFFPKRFGLEFMPVTFKILEPAMSISEVIPVGSKTGRLTPGPALVLAPP